MCAKLVREHALELIARNQLQNPFRHCHHGMLRIAPRGERIRLGVRSDRQRRHRKSRALAQPVDHCIELWRLLLADDASAVHSQHHLRRREVHDEVHEPGEHEREHHTALPTEVASDRDEQRGEPRE